MGWLPFSAFVLSVIGLADAGYQVYTHFTDTGLLGCSAKADACVLVQNSASAPKTASSVLHPQGPESRRPAGDRRLHSHGEERDHD